jgi:hypothetical protein
MTVAAVVDLADFAVVGSVQRHQSQLKQAESLWVEYYQR